MAYRLRLVAILSVAAGLTGVFDSYMGHAVADQEDLSTAMFQGGVIWLFGGTLVWSFEIILVSSRYGAWIRQLYFLNAIAFKSLVLVLFIICGGFFGQAVFHGLYNLDFLFTTGFLRTLAFVFSIIFVVQTLNQIIRIIGGHTLVNFILGRYRQPVREDKIFMFLDLVGSTPLAERLGDVGVQKMITTFFFDISEPIIEHGGKIHRYVGDQVVVTWPIRAGAANMRSIRCCFAIIDYVRDKAGEYEAQFGAVPAFRIGLHGGPVVISQIGDQKQEISYFGDTVNTAARIEQQCKALQCSLLVSGELLDRITLEPAYKAVTKGAVQLRGREHETELFTITRS